MPRKTKPKAKVTSNEKVLANLVGMKMTTKHPEMVAWMAKLVEDYPPARLVQLHRSTGLDAPHTPAHRPRNENPIAYWYL